MMVEGGDHKEVSMMVREVTTCEGNHDRERWLRLTESSNLLRCRQDPVLSHLHPYGGKIAAS